MSKVILRETDPMPSAEVRRAIRDRARRIGKAALAFQEVMDREGGFACGFFSARPGIYGVLSGEDGGGDHGPLSVLHSLVGEIIAAMITEDLGQLGISEFTDRLDSMAALCTDAARRARQSTAQQRAQEELIRLAEEFEG